MPLLEVSESNATPAFMNLADQAPESKSSSRSAIRRERKTGHESTDPGSGTVRNEQEK